MQQICAAERGNAGRTLEHQHKIYQNVHTSSSNASSCFRFLLYGEVDGRLFGTLVVVRRGRDNLLENMSKNNLNRRKILVSLLSTIRSKITVAASRSNWGEGRSNWGGRGWE